MAAQNDFSDLLDLKAGDFRQLRFLGEAAYVLMYRGQSEEAASVFQALQAIAPNDPVGYLGLAEIHLLRDEYQEADRAARQAARVRNVNQYTMALAYSFMARAALDRHNLEAAEKAWRQAEHVDPGGAWEHTAKTMVEGLEALKAHQGVE